MTIEFSKTYHHSTAQSFMLIFKFQIAAGCIIQQSWWFKSSRSVNGPHSNNQPSRINTLPRTTTELLPTEHLLIWIQKWKIKRGYASVQSGSCRREFIIEFRRSLFCWLNALLGRTRVNYRFTYFLPTLVTWWRLRWLRERPIMTMTLCAVCVLLTILFSMSTLISHRPLRFMNGSLSKLNCVLLLHTNWCRVSHRVITD